jgi:hypothetical protein
VNLVGSEKCFSDNETLMGLDVWSRALLRSSSFALCVPLFWTRKDPSGLQVSRQWVSGGATPRT